MEIKAELNYLRIAPRKVRLVANLIRGKSVKEAERILSLVQKKPALPLLKLLKSALANAKHNFNLKEENLRISKLLVNEGPKLKRWRARARGQAFEIQKKTSHVLLVLESFEKEEIKPKKEKPKVVKVENENLLKEKIPKKEKISPKEGLERKPFFQKAIKRVFKRKAF